MNAEQAQPAEQYKLGRMIATISYLLFMILAAATWIPMAWGLIPVDGLGLFIPIIPLGGLVPGLHAMMLHTST
jgi:hypothetical protein